MKVQKYSIDFFSSSLLVFIICSLCALVNSQCTYPFERCICSNSTSIPYCPCQYITLTQALNFSSAYYSHLVLINTYGCKPCDSGCKKCSNSTICTQCLDQFQLSNNSCIPCPINCKTCSNGVCSLCNNGYYIDYQNQCEMCPLTGINTCTIDSLTSCLANYWLDNNGANCINCDQNCQICSSTTKCSICNNGYYQNNFKCYKCLNQCQTCTNSSQCINCLNQSQYFNSSSLLCVLCSQNCYSCSNSSYCLVCNSGFYLTMVNLCSSLPTNVSIKNCQLYKKNSNSTNIICSQCTQGFYKLTSQNETQCYSLCSVLCLTCSGAHYGACSSCIQGSILLNQNCLPKYNINSGTAFQRYYTPLNNINSFNNVILSNPNYCWHEYLAISQSNFITVSLSNLNSYKVNLQWKTYIFNSTDPQPFYLVNFSNTQIMENQKISLNITTDCRTDRIQCNNSLICVHKYSLSFQVIRTDNVLTFSSANNLISLSQMLVTGYRCGGVYGDGCQECTDINTCIKCTNPSFFIIGQRCIIQCPQTYYTYYQKGICYQLCPLGTYSQDSLHQCFSCVYPCQTCSSIQKCLTCSNNTYLNTLTKQCLTQCPSRYYPDSFRKTCVKCVFPCLQCLSNYICLDCIYGFYSNLTSKCVLQCQFGFYGNLQTRKCQNCSNPCFECQDSFSDCLSCINGYSLYQNQCVLNCPDSYYKLNQSICQKCYQKCFTCQQSAQNCTSCNFGYFLIVNNNSCQQNCPISFYKNYLSLQCSSCPAQCQLCTSFGTCLQCYIPYLYDQSTYSCLKQCLQYFYDSNGTCHRCQLPCYDCYSQFQCSSCYDAFLFNSTCITQCPTGYYADVSILQCLKCDQAKCLQCENTNSTCTNCSTGLLLIEGQCLSDCWPNFYYSSYKGECVLCSGLCDQCLNQTFCLSCINNFILAVDQGICVNFCSSGYYKTPLDHIRLNSSLCQPCLQNCSQCYYDDTLKKQMCVVCSSNLYLLEGLCYENCPSSYYQYQQNYQCYKCSAPCANCKDQYTCQSCLQNFGYYFSGECLQNCPYRYYQTNINISSYVCQQCHISCQFCETLSDNCTGCKDSLYLIFLRDSISNKFKGSCRQNCSDGYFSLTYQNICYLCSQACLTCTSFSQCTSCNSSSVQHFILYRGKCISICPSSNYIQVLFDLKVCLPCSNGCSICVNSSFCLQCSTTFYINQNNTCATSCPPQTFSQSVLCTYCSYPCQNCNSSQICTTCKLGLFYEGKCTTSCPTGTFLINNNTCNNCSQNCSICTSLISCLFCQQGLLSMGICIQNCLIGYYSFYGACIQCSYGCLSCLNSQQCLQCSNGFLYAGNCIQYCPDGWVNVVANSTLTNNATNITKYECKKCVTGCQKCVISASRCIQCQTGMLLYIDQCLSYCPKGSYADHSLKICQICVSPCETCTNSYSCQTCIYGYLLYRQKQRNQCVQGPFCPNSYYLNLDTNICQYQCQANLYINAIKQTCSVSCQNGYVSYTSNMSCLLHCPSEMWVDQNYFCQLNLTRPYLLPLISCKALILRNNLIVSCESNIHLGNIQTLSKESFSLNFSNIESLIIESQYAFYLITSQSQDKIINQYLKLSFINPYSLLSAPISTSISLSLDSSLSTNSSSPSVGTSSLQYSYPVQNYQVNVFVKQFYYYTADQRNIGMNFYQIGQSIALGALVVWLFCMIKNLKPVTLLYLLNLQWLYSLCLIQNNYPPNLNQLLQGLKLTNLYFIYASKQTDQNIWKFSSDNNQALGINNLYNVNQSLIPIYILVAIFLSIFAISWLVYKVFDKSDIIGQESNLSIKAKIINERFFFNYTFHIVLFCASPFSICVYLAISNAYISSIIPAILLICAYTCIKIACLYKYLSQGEKCHRYSKYFLIQTIQVWLCNAFAIMSNFQFYMGFIVVLITLKLFAWHNIFKKMEPQRCFNLQIIQLIKIVLAVVFIISEMYKENWSSNDIYNYGFFQICVILVVIIVCSIQVSRQLFAKQENREKQNKKTHNLSKKQQTQFKQVSQNDIEDQQESQRSFFTNITPVESDSSDGDIIDFDQISEDNPDNKNRAAQLYRYNKQDKHQ